jgi:hypothetical protein
MSMPHEPFPDFAHHFRGHMTRLLDALVRSGKRGLTMGQMVDAIYAHRPDGGPDDPARVVLATISTFRGRLKSLGFNIERGGERYRLVRLPAEWRVPLRQGNEARQIRAAGYRARWYAATYVATALERAVSMEVAA